MKRATLATAEHHDSVIIGNVQNNGLIAGAI